MEIELTIPVDDWGRVSDALSGLRARGDEFEQFVLEQLDQLDELRGEFSDRRLHLDDQTQAVLQRGADLDQRLAELDALRQEAQAQATELTQEAERLAAAHHELDTAREELAIAQASGAAAIGEMDAALRQRVAELESCCTSLESDLDEKRRESSALADYTARLSELEQELAAARSELDGTRQELQAERQRQIAAGDDTTQELREQIAVLESERAELSEELEAARSQTARLASAAMELADARAELADSRELRLHERETVLAGAGHAGVVDEQLQLLQQERAALEAELEIVRNRAAELAETAADERRRGAEERAEWSGELKQLRRALEKQAQLLLRYQEVASASPAQLVEAPASRSANGSNSYAPFASDPVLDSVMAQFEMLQKDLVKRRGDHHKASRQDVA